MPSVPGKGLSCLDLKAVLIAERENNSCGGNTKLIYSIENIGFPSK